MTLYHLALFLHIIGAFGLVAAITVEAISLRGLRGATRSDDALMWLRISRGIVMRLAPASLGLAIVLGIALLMTVKPSGLASLVIIVLAVAIGLLAGQLAARGSRREYAPEVG